MDTRVHHAIGDVLSGLAWHADNANGRGGHGISHRLDDETGHLVTYYRRVRVVEGNESRAADQEVGGVHEGATEIADPHHDHVVEAIVTEGLGNAIDQDLGFIPRSAGAEGSQTRQVAAYGGRRHAR